MVASLNRSLVAENFLSAYFTTSSTKDRIQKAWCASVMLRLAWVWSSQPSRVSFRRVTLQSPLAPRLFPTTPATCSALRYSTMSDSESEAFDVTGVSGGSESEDFHPPTKKVC